MPEKLEKQLKAQAARRRLNKKKSDAFVYGTMRKTGWRPKQENSGGNYGDANS